MEQSKEITAMTRTLQRVYADPYTEHVEGVEAVAADKEHLDFLLHRAELALRYEQALREIVAIADRSYYTETEVIAREALKKEEMNQP